MKIFLSPAKRLNEKNNNFNATLTQPTFLNQAEEVMQSLRKYSTKDLQALQKISPDLAALNYERNHNWNTDINSDQVYPAAWLFDGEVYRGLRENELSSSQIEYLQQNLIILSGLYGALKVTDAIMPYRLEMGTDLKVKKHKNLYEFWSQKITDFVIDQIEEDEILLDLSSKEYISVLDKKRINGQWIDVKFKDLHQGKLKQITVYFKQARGKMAYFCAANQVKTLDELKTFNEMGYAFDDNLSTDKTLIFTR